MTRYQLAFAPFLNKYINDELSKHYGGRRVAGVLPGLQNQCGAWYVPGGFDSYMPPPKENMLLVGNPCKCEGLVRMFLRFRFCGIVYCVLYRFSFP